MFATTPPSGTISRDAFEKVSGHILAALDAEGPFDGVLMAQHGASVVGGASRRRRGDDPHGSARAVGPRVPIGVVVDTHGNISPAQLAPATVTLAWQTNPHVDCRERAPAPAPS